MSNPSAATTSLAGQSTAVATPVIAPTAQVILVKMAFGDAFYEFSSPFSIVAVDHAVLTASAIAVASGDHNASVWRDGVLIFTPEIFPLDVPVTDFCVDVLRECPSAFDVGNGSWELCVEFVFGCSLVTIKSSFPSHQVPWARFQAKAMTRAVGNCKRFSLQPPSNYPM